MKMQEEENVGVSARVSQHRTAGIGDDDGDGDGCYYWVVILVNTGVDPEIYSRDYRLDSEETAFDFLFAAMRVYHSMRVGSAVVDL